MLANRKVPGDSFGGTLISRNKGGQWSPLQAPAVDRTAAPISCFPVRVASSMTTYMYETCIQRNYNMNVCIFEPSTHSVYTLESVYSTVHTLTQSVFQRYVAG